MRAGVGHRESYRIDIPSLFFLPTQVHTEGNYHLQRSAEGGCSQTKSRRRKHHYTQTRSTELPRAHYNRSRKAAARVQPQIRKGHPSRTKRNKLASMGVLKRLVSTNPWLLRWARIIRALVMVGPVGVPLLRLCQRLNKSLPLRLETYPTFAHVDVDQVFDCLEKVGCAHIGQLPAEYVKDPRVLRSKEPNFSLELTPDL